MILNDLRLSLIIFFFAVTFSSLKDAGIKSLSGTYVVSEILFIRLAGDLVPAAISVGTRQSLTSLRTSRWLLHGCRAVCMVLTMSSLYVSFRLLPLAEAIALFMLGPVFITVLSQLLTRSSFEWRHVAVVLLGIAGAEVVIQPNLAAFQLSRLLPITAAFCYALVTLITRELGKTDSTVAISAYGSLIVAVALLTFASDNWTFPPGTDLAVFAAVAMAGGASSYLYVAAYQRASPPALAPLDYLGLVWAAVWGYAFWGEQPAATVWIGGALIVAAAALCSTEALER